jgi:hypothetical protein
MVTVIPIYGDPVTTNIINNTSIPVDIDTANLSISLSPHGSYEQIRQRVLQRKQHIKRSLTNKTLSPDSLYQMTKITLEDCILNKLIPFWYGTPWDFNGYTNKPNNGFIACGYFVSTILLHAGFSLNRYTLAQQNPYLEAVSIQQNDSVQVYKNGFDDFHNKFKGCNLEGLYFVGLDCHVGFLLFRANKLIFLHSSYVDPLCVTIENAENSPAFTNSEKYYIAEISTNRKLLDDWINGSKIMIRTK